MKLEHIIDTLRDVEIDKLIVGSHIVNYLNTLLI